MIDDDYRPRFNFADLIGVTITTIDESELTMEFVAEAVTTHLKTCNAMNPTESMVEGGLYFFGMYDKKSMVVQYLDTDGWINRDCFLFSEAIKRSFPGEDITFLPIHVLMKDTNEVVFRFTFGDQSLKRLISVNGQVDIIPLSRG